MNRGKSKQALRYLLGGLMMKKALIALLAAALCMSMLVALAGCGTDENKEEAKQAMIEGDGYMDAAREQQALLQEKQNELTASFMAGDTSVMAEVTGEEAQAEFKAILDDMQAELDAAEQAYTSIMEIEGVQDYKDYANKMIEAIGKYGDWLQAAQTLLGSVADILANLPPGQMPDVTQLANMPEIGVVTSAINEAEGLIKEADQIKLDKDL
jgi:hypothetical protein